MAHILDGKSIATALESGLARAVRACAVPPGLAVLLVGDDPASQVYVRGKAQACARVGIAHRQLSLPASTSEAQLLAQIDRLNADATIHAILVQQPLPPQIDLQRVNERIAPHKDVDGFHPYNVGRLAMGLPGPRPCTPLGIMHLLRHAKISPVGKRALIIGRSQIVGRPMAHLLLAADATVTIAHSKTVDLPSLTQSADILVAAVGRAHFIQGDWIQSGATVIDVGMNRAADGTLVGDIATEGTAHAAWITPVPGGVGPMTIAMLLQNTVTLASAQANGH